MSIVTISYNRRANNGNGGWNSFHSFNPESMVSMNSSMYTFKNGELYQHHSNVTRNKYYGTTYDSILKFVFNDSYNINKSFRTIELDSTSTWKADCVTDLSTGVVEIGYYKQKEGDYYSYIRREADTIDMKAMSTQGVGAVDTYAALTITFAFTIAASISNGDKVYINNGTTMTLVGSIDSHTSTQIVVDAAAVSPSPGDFIVVVKDSTAESFDLRGYYMEVTLTNSESDTGVELYSVASEASKSSQ